MDKVPTGFVPFTDPEVNPEGGDLKEAIEANYDKIPATLYTDRYGINYVVIEQNGEELVLCVVTD